MVAVCSMLSLRRLSDTIFQLQTKTQVMSKFANKQEDSLISLLADTWVAVMSMEILGLFCPLPEFLSRCMMGADAVPKASWLLTEVCLQPALLPLLVYLCQFFPETVGYISSTFRSHPPWASLVSQMVKNLPAMKGTWVQSLNWKDPLEKEMVTHSSILAQRIPWTEKPGGLWSMGSQRVRHDRGTDACTLSNHLTLGIYKICC